MTVTYSDNKLILSVAKIAPVSEVNGPGKRFVLWVQGCTLKCVGCVNQHFWSKGGGQPLSIDVLYDRIMRTQGIEGVTFSGGEPFHQSRALSKLAQRLKDHGISVMSYSGYTISEIMKSRDSNRKKLLSSLDILIDGRFERQQAAPLLWRGSSNQKVHFLSDRYKKLETLVDNTRLQVEISLNEDELSFAGNFSPELLKQLQEELKVYGVNVK